ncbi:MAG TPA: hypothetical protein VHX60_00890 [Acidobacteriaceae bacterium]|jgi:hypothetical protein|nr:hypothetical protein [Acidobacteriaceae bacterium]
MQNMRKTSVVVCRPWYGLAIAALLWIPLNVPAFAQQDAASTVPATATVVPVIPQKMPFSGAAAGRAGDTVQAVFRIYAAAEGGLPLWGETQSVTVDTNGQYSVVLGVATRGGLPQSLFASGQSRWLGVSLDGAEEGPRSPLTSVAYAMKAGDAESVGGVEAANLVTKDELSQFAQSGVAPQLQVHPDVTPSGSGIANYVPLWTGTSTLGDSLIYQAGGNVGIGVSTTPAVKFEVNGTVRSDSGITWNGATNGLGVVQGGDIELGGSSTIANPVTGGEPYIDFHFGTGAAQPYNVRLQNTANNLFTIRTAGSLTAFAVNGASVGIGTTTPAAVLEVNGAAKFDGNITFASTQTFPITGTGGGTITGITTTSPLTGSGTSGSVALKLNLPALETSLNSVYAELGATNNFTNSQSFGNGIASNMAAGSLYSAVNGEGTNGSVGVYGTSDTGYGVEGISTSGSGVYATAASGNGLTALSTSGNPGSFSNSSAPKATIYSTNAGAYDGSYYPVALNATSSGTDSVGTFAQGTLIGSWADTAAQGAYALYATASDAFAGYFSSNGTDYPSLYVINDASGTATTAPINIETIAAGNNAYGVYSDVSGNGAWGLFGESDGGLASGSGRSAIGVKGVATGNDSNGMVGDASGTGGYGLYARASGAADTTRYAPAGVYALADSGTGVEGFAVGQSSTFTNYQTGFSPPVTAGVWGDSSSNGANFEVGGIMGTADDNAAGFFVNNSAASATVQAYNRAAGGPSGLVQVFVAATPDGSCGIASGGSLTCTGQLKTLASTASGAHMVETYAMQSPENWMEDFGTGTLAHGTGVVQIDPIFADTIEVGASYHVFLTPRGDSKGLYVTNVTASSFEVRESGGGTSSLTFDYRIVAKRRGYEAQRLTDVTERFNAERASLKQRMPAAIAAHATRGELEANMVEHPATALRAARSAGPMARRNMRPGGGAPVMAAKPMKRTVAGPAPKPGGKPIH